MEQARRPVVLVVEDDALVRASIVRAVARMFTPIACATYAMAVDEIAKLPSRPAALIVDVHLGPDQLGDGFDVARIAHERFGGHIPTLVLTAVDAVAQISARAHRLRAELLFKPNGGAALDVFLRRALVKDVWSVPDVIDLDHAAAGFAAEHSLTQRQTRLLFDMLRAAERGERSTINPNTRKAALRRILAKTGHASFEDARRAIKLRAIDRRSR